jgi:hypothetical protein
LRGFVSVGIGRVSGERTSSVDVLVWDLLDDLSDEVVARVAHAAVGVPVVGGVTWASGADTSDSDIADLTEAAIFVPVLVESAGWGHEGDAVLIGLRIDLVNLALTTGTVDAVVALGTHTGLGLSRVYFVHEANNQDAVSVDE